MFCRNGEIVNRCASVRKSIYSLFDLIAIFKCIIQRYLEFLSSFDDPVLGVAVLESVVLDKRNNGRVFWGLNFFDKSDEALLLAIGDGRFTVDGLGARHLGAEFVGLASWRTSNILARLKALSLIFRVERTYKYFVTELSRRAIVAGLFLKNQKLIPFLAKA